MRRILQDIAETNQENNKLLKKLHRSLVVGRFFRIAYWLIIIAVSVGAFYFIQPYFEAVGKATGIKFNGAGGILEFFKNF